MPIDVRNKQYLGRGLAWPLQVTLAGGIALAGEEADVEQAIQIILLTAPGERVMRPEFGCRIHDLIFSPYDAATVGLIELYVEQALERWEPRVEVRQVDVLGDEGQDGALKIVIQYQIKDTHDERSIVHPFYLSGEEPAI